MGTWGNTIIDKNLLQNIYISILLYQNKIILLKDRVMFISEYDCCWEFDFSGCLCNRYDEIGIYKNTFGYNRKTYDR